VIKGPACELAPVQTRRLLSAVIAEAASYHLAAISCAEVEAVRQLPVAKLIVLEDKYVHNSSDHRISHSCDRILILPRALVTVLGKVSHIQSGDVLRIGRPKNIAVSVVSQEVSHVPTDSAEV